MYRIGLTGGVGSGKSTVSSYMHELGIPVIDGDKLAREAVIPGSRAMAEMRKAFGPHIFLPDGSLNRLKMGEIVFNDEEKRQKLNSIIHPFIWHRTREELIRAQEEGFPVVVLDMPLLLEISWQLRVEEVWLVEVPLEVQIARVVSRDGFTREQVMERIGKQMPTTNKMNYADVIIDNSRSVEDTRRQVREALKHVPGFQFPKGMEV
ncbi:MAG: dephospho-CoA kinase [Dialister sp.]|uniref:dephospho-CoA kinase n=1 Tax=Dialister sp. TaxID=1955814 RepID=UPI002E78659D|nr:dephospho-CoA kinase [Dialister sp.]MEE0292219.1 dephospho-CoA kinase [Dialister sp.]